ncbi:hypothetical protein PHLCEN_2v2269 [Hermanssonia centrifuga]|uniref:Uncharacterized protein n=1 Tax=Hermanssonia centrifuga TaxID=98765 RepID=A0A2R6RPI8_9APHY|nr:hypothetical protein PHLCEN_2v2269 [Hermanssonia centrifuga]
MLLAGFPPTLEVDPSGLAWFFLAAPWSRPPNGTIRSRCCHVIGLENSTCPTEIYRLVIVTL